MFGQLIASEDPAQLPQAKERGSKMVCTKNHKQCYILYMEAVQGAIIPPRQKIVQNRKNLYHCCEKCKCVRSWQNVVSNMKMQRPGN